MSKQEKELGKVNAYNWITQALCKKDSKGNYVVDDKFTVTPDEILFDLNRTGEFAKDEKNWAYRNTRGAGMGKAIMPYSGMTIGDFLYGVKKDGRQSNIRNPWRMGLVLELSSCYEEGRTAEYHQQSVAEDGPQGCGSSIEERPGTRSKAEPCRRPATPEHIRLPT